jgi:hypothetical protein
MALIDEAEIRRRYELLTAGEEMPDLLADEGVFNQIAEMPGTAGTFHGHEGAGRGAAGPHRQVRRAGSVEAPRHPFALGRGPPRGGGRQLVGGATEPGTLES